MVAHSDADAADTSHRLEERRFIATGLARTGMTYISLSLLDVDGEHMHAEVLRTARRGGRANPGSYAEFRTLVGRSQATIHPRRNRVEFVDMLLTPTDDLHKVIENHDTTASVLVGTQYERFL